jgi:integrase/recombinase XerD
MPKPRQRDRCGRFVETWLFDEESTHGPQAPLVLPKLPPPWKARWYRKRRRVYVDADRGRLNGKPVRLCRKPDTIVKAVEALEREIQQHGQLAKALTSAQRWMAAEAFLICERLGVVLIDVVREFEKTHPHGANARTLDQVRLELVAWKRKTGRSERHVLSLDYRLRKLVAAIGDKPVTSITTQDLEGELGRHADWNATTVHSVVQGWKIALNFAVRRGYAVKNPADRLELPQIVHAEPVILTVTEARRLLASTLFRDRDPNLPKCRAYLAIGMFAGVRPEEMQRLDWRQVDLGACTITILATNAKCRVRRIVIVEPVLREWLLPVSRACGPVLPEPLDVLRQSTRAVLGLSKWPQDILRHTFASYHFEKYHDEARTKKQIGHRDDGRVFYNHYCRPVYPADAAAFWSFYPPVGFLTA